jgi:hypothetical protein
LASDGSEWSASHPSHFISRERAPTYPSDKRVGGPQSQPGHVDKEKLVKIHSDVAVRQHAASTCLNTHPLQKSLFYACSRSHLFRIVIIQLKLLNTIFLFALSLSCMVTK